MSDKIDKMCRWCVLMVMAVMSHPVAASQDGFLLTDCRVEGDGANLKFTLYHDTLILHLIRNKPNAIPVVVIRQDNNQWRFLLPDVTKLWKWEEVELKLSEKPQVFLNKKKIDATGSQEEMMNKRWEVEIENAWGYAGCEKRWPVLELDSGKSRHYHEIPRSGHNDTIKLLPMEATIVRLKVGEEEKVLCQEGKKVVVKAYNTSQPCQNLNPNTFTNEIDIRVNDENKSIKILRQNLTGVLYIVHCVDACDYPAIPTPGDPSWSSSTNYYMMMGLIIFITTTVILAVVVLRNYVLKLYKTVPIL